MGYTLSLIHIFLLAGMVLVFALLVGPAKYLKLSNIMNVICLLYTSRCV